MKMKDEPTRRIRVMIHETQANRMVPGTSRCLSLYDTTSEEVFQIIKAAIEAHIKGAQP